MRSDEPVVSKSSVQGNGLSCRKNDRIPRIPAVKFRAWEASIEKSWAFATRHASYVYTQILFTECLEGEKSPNVLSR